MSDEQECACCGFSGAKLKPYPMRAAFPKEETKLLCMLCAASEAGTIWDYRYSGNWSHETVAIVGVICNVANNILKAIESVKADA